MAGQAVAVVRDARWGLALAVAAAVVGTACIVSTYPRLSHTWDEATHVAAGIEVFQKHRYTYQTENPPLSRLTISVGPWLAGAQMPQGYNAFDAADTIFHSAPDYVERVTVARIGTLPWYWACIALTWMLAGGRRHARAAALASAAVATMPPLVGHAGFATTDLSFVASVLLVLVVLQRFIEQPGSMRAVWVGVALGFSVAAKFSALPFVPPVVIAVMATHYWPVRDLWVRTLLQRATLRWIGLVAIAGALTIWAAYGFRMGRMADLASSFGTYGDFPTTGLWAALAQWRIPAHEFFHGLVYLKVHADWGHRSMLFGEFSQRGFIEYYPVVLATKTPVPFLLLIAGGIWGVFARGVTPRSRWFTGITLGAVGLLAAAMTSPINIGVRHVLVLYPLAALAAAAGWIRWAESSRRPALFVALGSALIATQAVLLAGSVPYQSSYFNVFAGDEPAHIVSDSDFDWGQDGLALEAYFKANPVPSLFLQLQGTVNPCRLQLPPFAALPVTPVAGWIVISERVYRLNRTGRADPCALSAAPLNPPIGWLEWLKPLTPVATIGKTIRLYHVTEQDLPGR
jgi:hypothetical protein